MNVTELARQLRIHPQKMLQILPEFGFDIGAKSIKVDDRVAQQIQRQWKQIKFILDKREKEALEKEKQKEKELRRESGVSVSLPPTITVRELADRLKLPINKLIVELMKNGILATQNEKIDYETAAIISGELGFAVAAESVKEDVNGAVNEHVQKLETALTAEATVARPPVIVVMGHVDHGKTKLLDAIRSANVVATEAGGITQHIGAYQVTVRHGGELSSRDGDEAGRGIPPFASSLGRDEHPSQEGVLTFIDTPGHEAFTVMRGRGAKVADIAILVVAADDSVKPQTVEAINIIKAAKLPLVVAINKIDKPGADPQRVRNDLAQHNIIPDDWGGDTPMVEISAKENKNIDKLLDTLEIVADLHRDAIKANPIRPAAGTVIEAHVDKGAGPVATILVQTGTLNVNDSLVVNGEIYGKARALKNYRGEDLASAPPSTPVRILGFKIAPQVGDVLDNSSESNAAHVDVRMKRVVQTGAEQKSISVGSDAKETEEHKTLNVVIKADTLGSLEAIIGSLERLKNNEVGVKVVGKGLGNVTADDVQLAETAKAILFAFHVTTMPIAFEMLQKSDVQFRQHKIIYALLDEVKDELEKLLVPEIITTELGNLKVIAIFRTDKKLMIVGGRVESGKLFPDTRARIKRGGEIIGLGKITKVQIGKQEMKEVPAGSECGVAFEGKIKLEEGDILEAYKEEKKEKKLVLN